MKKTLLAVAIAACVAAGAGYFIGRQHTAPAASGEQAQERKVLYWYDPMVPDQRFDKPGKSPFMDMPLKPRYADEAPASGGVSVSAQQQQNLGMTTAKVEKRVLGSAFSAFATVTTDERSIQSVPSPAAGVVEKLFVRAPQQWVKKGEALAQLWIPQWTTSQQEYLAVRHLGDGELTRAARERLALQFMPEAIIRAVERSGKPQTRLTLRADRDGYVVKLDSREGAQVAATQTLFELASLDPVWLVVDYPQSQAQALSAGSEVIATSASWPGEQFHGRVSELLPQLETTTRTLKARIVLDNPQQKLKPGMFLTVTQPESARQPAVLAIPEEALIATGAASRVLLATGDGHFQAANVTTGRTAQGWTEVLSGVKEGDNVVTSGQFLIDSEASLRSALPEQQAQQQPAAKKVETYEGTGVVKAIEAGSITLSHQPIPALNWGAMTMDFVLKQPDPSVKPGETVMFSFVLDDEEGAVITHLMPMQEEMK
ncbi:efflux RND transporter periplasmic adaptor subunit [Kosakonia radicincitans]|uniref:efflux RND transporter periplasmic adaptor subunit n=1 Tax=Kosakonia radicincitans TaxID=283686 RepID=UPI000569518A|nr:efflux RND transporter periplasmic adaptor subunit [Kosakonia radicincitans]MDD7995684.1 efflux RND transporter periplasmic adaptor subunit [Kosakonia radicincitans]SET08082.1 membrane fusion protein, Cu(I)/Ag(I) efflux system [Kosakonia radicincitans]SKC23158.1 membrane fusion protein, Cu(I)/Ag(I) efflux system [Kosakonia radicincitans]